MKQSLHLFYQHKHTGQSVSLQVHFQTYGHKWGNLWFVNKQQMEEMTDHKTDCVEHKTAFLDCFVWVFRVVFVQFEGYLCLSWHRSQTLCSVYPHYINMRVSQVFPFECARKCRMFYQQQSPGVWPCFLMHFANTGCHMWNYMKRWSS